MEKKLPEGWASTQIGKIVKVSSGDGLTSKQMISDGTVPVFGGNGINGYHNRHNVYKRTIVIGRVGFYCGCVHLTPENAWVTDNALIVKYPEEYLDGGFLFWLLTYQNLGSAVGSTAQPVVSGTKIYQKNIPLPPLAEQKRIAAKLDIAFGHLENIEFRWRTILDLRDKFIESSLIQRDTNRFYKTEKLSDFLEESTKRIGKDWRDKLKVGVSAQKGIIHLETGQKTSFENYKIVLPGDFVYNAMRVNIGSIAQYAGKEIAITSPDYIVFRVKRYLSPKLLLEFPKITQRIEGNWSEYQRQCKVTTLL